MALRAHVARLICDSDTRACVRGDYREMRRQVVQLGTWREASVGLMTVVCGLGAHE